MECSEESYQSPRMRVSRNLCPVTIAFVHSQMAFPHCQKLQLWCWQLRSRLLSTNGTSALKNNPNCKCQQKLGGSPRELARQSFQYHHKLCAGQWYQIIINEALDFEPNLCAYLAETCNKRESFDQGICYMLMESHDFTDSCYLLYV